MPLIHFAVFLALLSPILSEHIENYYLEYLANHYSEYENKSSAQGNATTPTNRLFRGSSVGDNEYYLYTRSSSNSPDLLVKNNYDSIRASPFNPALPVIVIVHGWGGDVSSDLNGAIKDAFLNKSAVNVIVVDWSQLSKKNYITTVRGVPDVGKHLGNFLAYLSSSTGASFNQMHLIGHSLGAHVVGNAGRQLNARVARISGLDPAGPLWSLNPKRLQSTDAHYVEVIHTNRGILGIDMNCGVADFYPNGGALQPGCISPSCSHARSWQLFASSVTYNHLQGRKCDNKFQAVFNVCNGAYSSLGTEDLVKHQYGMYALSTSSSYPY